MNVNLTGRNWLAKDGIWARGYCFDANGVLCLGSDLLDYFEPAVDEKSFCNLLKKTNGIFSVIINHDNFKAIAIDGTRIYPLFYKCDGELTISDNPNALVNDSSNLDKLALEEYLCSGAVFAGKTLISEIKQAKPAHYIVFENNSAREEKFWSYCVKKGEESDCTLEQLDSAFESAFRRMLESIGGRQIVVPLSGGLDSRLIACWLKRLGVENVVCYTIGRLENKEYLTARKVAEKLGYRHYFIDNTSDEFVPSDFFDENGFCEYCHFVGGFGNFLWVFECFAVKWLKDNGLIDQNAVFVPGHSADFIAGSHLKKALVTPNKSVRYLTDAIMHDSFEYGCRSSYVRNEVKSFFAANEKLGISAHTNYMSFIMQNRLAHNINNSARLYEFFGYDVRLPFWDKDLLDLFKSLPYERLENCCLYVEYVQKCVFANFELDLPIRSVSRKTIVKQHFKNRLKPFLPKSLLRKYVFLEDDICERELTVPMVKALVDAGIYMDNNSFLSYNEVMRDWYLLEVRRKIAQ